MSFIGWKKVRSSTMKKEQWMLNVNDDHYGKYIPFISATKYPFLLQVVFNLFSAADLKGTVQRDGSG